MINNPILWFDFLGLDKCEIHIFIGHGARSASGREKEEGDLEMDDISPDAQTGSYAQKMAEQAGEKPYAVGIAGCWTHATISAVNEKRKKAGKAPINWINEGNSLTYRTYSRAIGETRDPGKTGPGEPPNYVPKTHKQVMDSLKANAEATAATLCECCDEVKIYIVSKGRLWGYNKALYKTINCSQ